MLHWESLKYLDFATIQAGIKISDQFGKITQLLFSYLCFFVGFLLLASRYTFLFLCLEFVKRIAWSFSAIFKCSYSWFCLYQNTNLYTIMVFLLSQSLYTVFNIGMIFKICLNEHPIGKEDIERAFGKKKIV